ncbi:MAG: hypothetical protein ACJ8FY_13405 [Gemmataceae bacterium]
MRLLSYRSMWLAIFGLFLGSAFLTAAPGSAPAKIDSNKLLPDDTEAVIAINFKQLFESALIKKIHKNGTDNEHAKELGFDPMKDLESVVFAIPGGGNGEKALIIVNGTFDVEKIQAKVDEAAKEKGDHVKVHETADGDDKYLVYELTNLADLMKNLPPQLAGPAGANPLADKSIFAGFSSSAVLISGDKDQVVDGLKKAAGKKKTDLKSKEMKDLLGKIDSKRTISLAILASAIGKEATDKFENITGGITVASDIQTEIHVAAKDEKAAKDLNKEVDQGLEQVNGILGFLITQNKQLTPVIDVVKGIKATAKDSSVTIKSSITEATLKQLGDAIQAAMKQHLGGPGGGNDKESDKDDDK